MIENTTIQKLFEAGAHYGYSRTRRNPTVTPFIFGQKNRNDIFDLEITLEKLNEAITAVQQISQKGKDILFIAGKNEARIIMRHAAEKADQPFVCSRWIGGTLTNFKEISKRVRRLDMLRTDKEKGNLEKYTKKERLLLDREIGDLDTMFGGIAHMKELPGAIFVVDPRYEETAVKEAKATNIPIIALANTDCDLSIITYPIPANDATTKSITFFVDSIVDSLIKGKKEAAIAREKKEKDADADAE